MAGMLYRDIVDWARTAVAAAGPMARLRGMLFMEVSNTPTCVYVGVCAVQSMYCQHRHGAR